MKESAGTPVGVDIVVARKLDGEDEVESDLGVEGKVY